MTAADDRLGSWLIWQNSIHPFLYKESFSNELLEIVAKKNKNLKLKIMNTGKEELKPIEKLKKEVSVCRGCRLHKTRKNVVFGEGVVDAKIMFIGEGPGKDEDETGTPFVGKAGELLTKIIENGMKISRESVYIANIVKCRPPSNRDPLPDEASECMKFLIKQIEIVNPKVIILLGKVAAKHLLGIDESITKAREESYSYDSAKVFVTYHPSALLRNESYKRPVWEDIKKVLKYLENIE
ncbi:MAG: uracil-DNA glycosylase [bacterium]